MIELGLVGARNSGKTTLMVGLVEQLCRRGIRVATAKHTSHHHRFDREGSDSFRHRQAGAGLTLAISEREVGVFAEPECLPLERLREFLESQFDVWLVEGDKSGSRPKILATRGLSGLRDGVPSGVIATIGPEGLPQVPVHLDSGDLDGLVEFVMGLIDQTREVRGVVNVA